FSPAYTAPLLTRLPSVVAIHDVSYAAHPDWFRPSERRRRNFVSRHAARRAAAVTTLSEFSAAEIARLFGLARARIHIIPPGAPARPPGAARSAPRDPLIVFVGSIFNRRHVPLLIDAFARVARSRPDATLFVAGANRTWPHEDIRGMIDASEARSRITWLEDASNALVAEVLSRASATAFLSEYEGFAMTPFEGLAHGAPPVLLDTPVARDVYGDAALYVATGDAGAAAHALTRLLDDPLLRQSLVAHAEPMWARFDWVRSADAMLGVLREAAR
ncbi:MAG: glycosyltransferase, partial [Acidobacteriota bacterium]|nr:glycosyltransferase [Acidobacteriota bacterium]